MALMVGPLGNRQHRSGRTTRMWRRKRPFSMRDLPRPLSLRRLCDEVAREL
jgi:hypothetical protein